MINKSIYVTQPSLAPLEEYMNLLKSVWETGVLTHNGPLVQRLETDLREKLNCSNLSVVNNGTFALQMAIKAMDLQGEIITTSFTWVATVSAIKWEGCQPIFCDIDSKTLNIDVDKIESLITEKTVAIMPVHVFGNACDVLAIERIAKKHNIKVIYDAAHAIGTSLNGVSIFNFGDVSATSLHATKLFNTGEGGACITRDNELHERIKRIRFFGHNSRKEIVEDGFNGKMTEVHAALGLANLSRYDEVLADRAEKYEYYIKHLSKATFLSFQENFQGSMNFSYFPVIFDTEQRLLESVKKMNQRNIFPRRYFYPSVNTFEKIVTYQETPIAEDVSKRILCLPHYLNLSREKQNEIIDIILNDNS